MKTNFNQPLVFGKGKLLMTVMKTFIFLCCMATFGFGPKTAFAQNEKILIKSDTHLSVVQVFELIKNQTEHTFIYRSDLFDQAPKIFLKKGKIKANDLLKKSLSFGNFDVNFTSDGAILLEKKPFTPKKVEVQQIVSGTVTDSNGYPLPGASITLKENSTIGVQTDFDGNFSIEVPNPQTTLVIRYLGFMTQEVIVGNQSQINIIMEEDAQSLDEIVVVGYGTQKKSDVTGAISTVKSEELTKVVSTNPVDALQGRVSGVTVTQSSGSPGSASDIMIRGIGSFGNNQPLYIVDGVQADPYFIDSNNIASIEILKDAASGAIYGTRAANGVVIISTKKGKSGKPKVEIGSSLSMNTVRKKMNLLDAQGYIDVHTQMYQNAGAALPQYLTNPPATNTDWINETHRDGLLHLQNVRVSGASEFVDYSISGNFADETGILLGSEFTKKGISANIGTKKGRLNIKTNLTYSETYREDFKFSLRETYFISPLIPVLDSSKESGYGFRSGDIPDHRNPVGEAKFFDGYTKLKYFLGNVNIGYEIIDGLNFNSNFSLSNLANYTYNFHQPFRVRDVQDDPQREFSFISEYNSEFRRLNQEYTLNYEGEIGKNTFQLLAGYQRISEPFKETYAQGEGYKLDEDNNKVPAIILDPNFNTLNAFNDGTYSANGTNAKYALVSQFGRVNYTYDNKYLFQASVRRDGSSKFGKNNKYGVFPSYALGWKITDEEFMKDQELFNFLKLRYSWGQAGNDSALGYYDYVALISQGKSQNDGGYVFGNPQNSSLGSIARSLQNDNLQWETNTSSNFGLDFAALGNKLTGAINYYNSTTEDLLIIKEVSPSAGINNPVVNVGEFQNKGIEIELGYTNKDNDFQYSLFSTFTTINSEVTKLSNENQVLFGTGLLFGSDHFVNQTRINHEPGAYFLPVADGIFQNQAEVDAHSVAGNLIQPDAAPGDIRFIDQNGDGIINSEDETYQGTAIPKYEYSLNLSANYKGFDFNVFFQGVGGNKIYNGNDFRLLSMDTGRNFRTATLNSWTPSNTNTDMPRAVLGDPNQNNRASTRFLQDGDYLRLKTIQLGYSFPESLIDNTFINRLRLYATGQNLLTFTKYDGLDPEVGGSILSRGIDINLYPKYKSVILGLQLQF
ncbi:SusC/RagA family TonB-linked outer membrane protein [Arenibacter amylolyticus]|uniref:SusC/RagA family TonB-linked outer membrane protein n=1 Tax=Arenibacter amylolyticus TaxID=1406873 RepID=UPI000A3AF9BB|nr:TonB-dependent receptor [Arenibacter amylolyticus]